MTEKEIEVGEYIRTKRGLIGKVNKIELKGSGTRFAGEFITDTIIQFNDGKVYERRVTDKDIVKHSKNIIDLIEVGDIVHTRDVLNEDIIYIWTEEYLKALKEDLKNGIELVDILTKEQYKANCYTVERKEDERYKI